MSCGGPSAADAPPPPPFFLPLATVNVSKSNCWARISLSTLGNPSLANSAAIPSRPNLVRYKRNNWSLERLVAVVN